MKTANYSGVTLSDRLDHGLLTVDELAALKACGRTQIYADIKAGALPVVKQGRSTRIAGPVARDYIPGARHTLDGKAA